MISSNNEGVWRPADYAKRLRVLDLRRVTDWMRTQGWRSVQEDEFSDCWMLRSWDGDSNEYVDVPNSQENGDFIARMNEVVEAVAVTKGWRGWVALEMLESL